ncbi:MAG TPA: ABC transporter ATP-binding protein [Candidatus Dojkabacteria bacterium]|nr:ABC transporter ATP-binding protein [Candidatus Dojkabacteria bacterium]HOR06024.1 ABC transporter ATP-binding protein [Candidatus Dojkabacteria bacterium]
MPKNIIELKNITKIYKSEGGNTLALDDIDLNIQQGEFLAIMGPSGSGKSTLMNILGLLDVPTSGTYILNEQKVSKLKEKELAKIRNKEIGFVFQQFNLLPRTTVFDNVLMPTIYGDIPNPKEKAEALIDMVGLKNWRKHKSNQLSGGQIQRVAIARALMMDPSIILADEPTGNLDTKRSAEIMELFKEINEKGSTIVLITHEEYLANYASRIIHIQDGKIIKEENKK